jgi:Ni,Fe-hydrogenase I small subunit
VVNCNVAKRGWMDDVGGCPNVRGICIGCTMPGFPDKFMPFMDAPPGAAVSIMSVREGLEIETEIASDTAPLNGLVVMRTFIGGTRVVDMLSGEQLPRIC